MNKISFTLKALLLWGALSCYHLSAAGTDTLRVLSYNILYIGDTPPCQGPHNIYEGYIQAVLSYVNPDIVGFVKAEAQDANGSAPTGFIDSLLQTSFNGAFPGRFAYCPITNVSAADNISMLFYNQQKLGYAGILCTYANITDFTTYKLYYKSTDLATTHDTIFLYVTLNHDNSGTGSSNAATREDQIGGEMAQIETHFSRLPNMINMGDFNTHTSTEACYQTLVAPSNLNYRYYDPPFYPDATFAYPADWDDNPNDYASCLTVSTRENSGSPNSCSGNTGGGKSWYDHIFLSANIINDSNCISYLPNSFKVIGNDGNRVGISVNSSSPANTSAPAAVINDIYQLSEHYPLTLTLLVTPPASSTGIGGIQEETKITVANPVDNDLNIRFAGSLNGKTIGMTCVDALGRVQMQSNIMPAGGSAHIPCTLIPGVYYLSFTANGEVISQATVVKR